MASSTWLIEIQVSKRKRKAPGVKGAESLTCAREGIRTPNLLIRSQMLYPLSYARLCSFVEPVKPTCFLQASQTQ